MPVAGQGFERPIDFIIIHEHMGLLAMEVKGGKIHIGEDGGFEQYQYRKGWQTIDPYAQVKLAVRELIKVIKSDSPQYWIPDNICVLFPHTNRAQITNIPQELPDGTLCADDMALLSTIIPSLLPKNTKPAWPRDVFIDVRRRLQNMPQAKDRSSATETTAGPQKIQAVKPQPNPLHKPAVIKPAPPPIRTQTKITIKQHIPPDTPRPARPKPRKKRLSVLDSLLATGLVALIVLLIAWLCVKA
jgi:hypothetical protein